MSRRAGCHSHPWGQLLNFIPEAPDFLQGAFGQDGELAWFTRQEFPAQRDELTVHTLHQRRIQIVDAASQEKPTGTPKWGDRARNHAPVLALRRCPPRWAPAYPLRSCHPQKGPQTAEQLRRDSFALFDSGPHRPFRETPCIGFQLFQDFRDGHKLVHPSGHSEIGLVASHLPGREFTLTACLLESLRPTLRDGWLVEANSLIFAHPDFAVLCFEQESHD